MGSHVSAPALYAQRALRFDQGLRADRPDGECAGRGRRAGRISRPRTSRNSSPTSRRTATTSSRRMAASARRRTWRACCSPPSSASSRSLVAYRGTGPALNDLIGGHVDYFCEQVVSVAAARSRAARSRPMWCPATRARRRCRTCRRPRKPASRTTRSASGARSSRPRARRRPIVAKLADALDKTLDDPAVARALAELGGTVPPKAERGPAISASCSRPTSRAGIRS